MKSDMHKQLQNSVCFQLSRRTAANPEVEDSITLGDIVIVLLLFVDIYALDAAAASAAKYILLPLIYGVYP